MGTRISESPEYLEAIDYHVSSLKIVFVWLLFTTHAVQYNCQLGSLENSTIQYDTSVVCQVYYDDITIMLYDDDRKFVQTLLAVNSGLRLGLRSVSVQCSFVCR